MAQRFALELVTQRRVSEDLFASAQRTFGTKGVFDMTVLASYYQAVCSVLSVFQVPAPTE